MFIYERSDWPRFRWSDSEIISILAETRNLQGKITGRMSSLGFSLQNTANLDSLETNIIKSSEIEGEIFNPSQVRSSIARRLGINIPGFINADRKIDGAVEMTLDAITNFDKELTRERLFAWHNSLFPAEYSSAYNIKTGVWRDDSNGPMQVVSGPMGKEQVHFQAPPAETIGDQMLIFFEWFNGKDLTDLVIKAAIAHLWFVTIHPFEDGNGRIARIIADMLLARADGYPKRFYSMSAQIMKERKIYYDILEETQQGDLDITNWIQWFLKCLLAALKRSEDLLNNVIFKHNFWAAIGGEIINERQKKVLNLLLEGFEGKLTSTKWARINKCSQDTALRDINDLISKNILSKLPGGGRSAGYELMEKSY